MFVPSWHEFENSIAVEVGLLHSQLFANSHLHFLIIVQPAAFKALLQHFSLVCLRGEMVHTVMYVANVALQARE